MSLGNRTSGITHTVTLSNIKKDDEKAFLEAYQLSDKSKSSHSFVQGELTGIKFGKGQYQDQPEYLTIAFYIKDGDETYLLKSGFERITYPIRAIMNKLLSVENFKDIRISIFGEKGDYKNVAIYENVSFDGKGTKVDYAIGKEEQQQYIFELKGRDGKVKERDFTDLDNHLIDCLKKMVVPNLSGNSPVSDEVKQTNTQEEAQDEQSHTVVPIPDNTTTTPTAVPDNDLPF